MNLFYAYFDCTCRGFNSPNLHLVPRLRMRGSSPPLPMKVQDPHRKIFVYVFDVNISVVSPRFQKLYDGN